MNPIRQETYRTGFIVLDTALDLARCLREPIARIQSRDRSLADQIRRAASSIPLNISEGNRRAGNDRKYLWRVAAGSADEVKAALLVAEAWGYAEPHDITRALDLIDQVLAMLWKLTR